MAISRQKVLILLIIPPVAITAIVFVLGLLLLTREQKSRSRPSCFLSKGLDISHSIDAAQEPINMDNIERLTRLASSHPPWSIGFSISDAAVFDVLLSFDDQMLVISGMSTFWDSRRSGSYWYSSIAIWEINKRVYPLCYLIPNKGPRHITAKGISADNRYVHFEQYGRDDSLGDCKGIRCFFVYDRISNQELEYTGDLEYLFETNQDQLRFHPTSADNRSGLCAHEIATDEFFRYFLEYLDRHECIESMIISSDRKFVVVLITTQGESGISGRIEIWGIVDK